MCLCVCAFIMYHYMHWFTAAGCAQGCLVSASAGAGAGAIQVQKQQVCHTLHGLCSAEHYACIVGVL